MKNEAKKTMTVVGSIIGMIGSVAGTVALIENNEKIYFSDIKRCSIVVTDDDNGIHYHLAQKKYDNKFDEKYLDILMNKTINDYDIKYIDEAISYFTPIYEKEPFYYKKDLINIIDDMYNKSEYITSAEKVKVMVK